MNLFKILFILGIFSIGNVYSQSSRHFAVSYDFSGGRFGDNLLAYLHAKWLSYQYDCPLLYKPFHYSFNLVMHDEELWFDNESKRYKFMLNLTIKKNLLNKKNTVFICPYFPEADWELKFHPYYKFNVNWKDEKFRQAIKKKISPKQPLNLIHPPHCLSIAMHIRDGGSYEDKNTLMIMAPPKVPPINFYILSLGKILELFPNQSMYCHIFSDAINPQAYINDIISALPANAPIEFGYRKEHNNHDLNVLEDFFSLFNFDILIRPASNFSIIPSLIHDYAVVAYPSDFTVKDKKAEITNIQVEKNIELIDNCLRKYH